MGLAFSYAKNPSVQWRTPIGLSMVFPTILAVALYFTPESPRYLLFKNRPEEAWKILSKIHYDPRDENQAFVKEEFFQMQRQLEFDRTLNSSWLHMFKKPSYRKRLGMVSLVTFLGQSTAVLVAAAYVCCSFAVPSTVQALTVNRVHRFTPNWALTPNRASSCNAAGLQVSSRVPSQPVTGPNKGVAGSIPAAIVGVTLCDKYGRKVFIMTGYVGCLVSLCVLTAMLAVYAPSGTNKVGLGWAVAALYMIVIFYCVGVEACGSPFYTEIFPTHIRAKGVCFCVFVNSLVNLLYLEVAPTALANIGWKFLLVSLGLTPGPTLPLPTCLC